MHITRAGSVLLILGLIVGGAAGIGLMVGFEPARLPAALLNIAAYKLTFAAAGGLLVAGAMLIRYARERGRDVTPQAVGSNAPLELREGSEESDAVNAREREHARANLDR